MPAPACAPLVEELSTRRDELTAHRDRLAAQLWQATPRIRTSYEITALREEVARVIGEGTPGMKRQLFSQLLIYVDVLPTRGAYPYFRVPNMDKPGPVVARACNRTNIRRGYQIVEMVARDTNPGPTIPGDRIRLGGRKRTTPNWRNEVLAALVDTPQHRLELAGAVLDQRDAGHVDPKVAALAIMDLNQARSTLMMASLAQAIAVANGNNSTPTGLVVAAR